MEKEKGHQPKMGLFKFVGELVSGRDLVGGIHSGGSSSSGGGCGSGRWKVEVAGGCVVNHVCTVGLLRHSGKL